MPAQPEGRSFRPRRLFNRRNPRGHDGQGHRHGFEQGATQPLTERWEHEQIRRSQELRRIVTMTQEAHATVQRRAFLELAEDRRLTTAAPGDEEHGTGTPLRDLGHRLEQEPLPLLSSCRPTLRMTSSESLNPSCRRAFARRSALGSPNSLLRPRSMTVIRSGGDPQGFDGGVLHRFSNRMKMCGQVSRRDGVDDPPTENFRAFMSAFCRRIGS